jgi:hypothetical protein
VIRQERTIRLADLDERSQQAIEELEQTIAAKFPSTTFVLARSPEDLASIHLLAIVDVDDPDEVGDLVVERVVALNVDEGIPLHVIPLRTPERVRAAMETDRRGATTRLIRSPRLLTEPV